MLEASPMVNWIGAEDVGQHAHVCVVYMKTNPPTGTTESTLHWKTLENVQQSWTLENVLYTSEPV